MKFITRAFFLVFSTLKVESEYSFGTSENKLPHTACKLFKHPPTNNVQFAYAHIKSKTHKAEEQVFCCVKLFNPKAKHAASKAEHGLLQSSC